MIDPGSLLLKVALAPAALFVSVDVLPKVVQSGFETAALTAGGIAGLLYLARGCRRAHKHSRALVARFHTGMDRLDQFPELQEDVKEVKTRLAAGDERFALIEEHIAVIADADKLRVKDAIAGDSRSPVDRRAA